MNATPYGSPFVPGQRVRVFGKVGTVDYVEASLTTDQAWGLPHQVRYIVAVMLDVGLRMRTEAKNVEPAP